VPRPANPLPSYTLHKPTALARVRVAGRDLYLGPYGSPESRQRYARLLAELAAPRPVAAPDAAAPVRAEFSVAELCEAHARWAERRYRPRLHGAKHSTMYLARWIAREVAERYGRLPVSSFGPRTLRELRDSWAASGRFCRREVNRRQHCVARMFRWGVAEELVPPSTLQALAALPGLRLGEAEVRDNPPRRPCSDAQVAAVLPWLDPPAAALLRLLRATGMRPDEACRLRLCDVDTSGAVWLYRLDEHKTAHRGHERVVALNEAAQAAIRERMTRPDGTPRPLDAFAFDPADAGKPNRHGRYLPNTLYQVLRDACDEAGIERFSPYAIRHAVATELRNRLGIEAVEAVLGQRSPAVAERYSRDKTARAIEAVRSIGGAA
jgi:integrase